MPSPSNSETAPLQPETGEAYAHHARAVLERCNADILESERVLGWNSIDRHIPDARCIVWWMCHSHRGIDTRVGDVAIALANELALPLVLFFNCTTGPAGTQLRHVEFMYRGLGDAWRQCLERGATIVVSTLAGPGAAHVLVALEAGVVVTDHDAMPAARRSRMHVGSELRAPLIGIDDDVIVPMQIWPKPEYAARTLRPKLHRVLEQFSAVSRTVPSRARIAGPDSSIAPVLPAGVEVITPASREQIDVLTQRLIADAAAHPAIGRVATPLPEAASGATQAAARLEQFVRHELNGYATRRNAPELDATSRLSPFLHFGQLAPARVLDAVRSATAPGPDIDAFVEEFVVRRELAVNHVYRSPDAGTWAGLPNWARMSLDAHRGDAREWTYDLDELTAGRTHDPLWNAAQHQMMQTGHMHGYVRMYWAKKILEWSSSPELAFEHALALNDCWHLDGRDPNGIVGVAWAVGGLHDRPWKERPIFGMVRYMSLASTGRKFNSANYIARWTGSDMPAQLW